MARFQSSGRNCIAPNWPGRDLPIEDLRRRHPDKALGRLTLTQVVEHFCSLIKALPQKPIAIGHSMGGLIVQILLQRELVLAGVAIDPAPPVGVLVGSWSLLKSNWQHITPFKATDQPIEMTFRRFQYTFMNGLPLEEQRAAYSRYVVPESRGVPRESLRTKVDFGKQRAPLLIIAGSSDHIVPAKLNRLNYAKYLRSPQSITDYREFQGRTHFIIGQNNWEQVADSVLGWLKERKL